MSQVSSGSKVALREINKENLWDIFKLEVAPEQRKYVASNSVSIAQAYFDRETAWFRAIYADETPVGFLMLADDSEAQEYFIWRLMIDARYQKFGFAKRALEQLFEYVRTRPGAEEVKVSYVPGDGGPQGFYEKMGFRPTGEIIGTEVVMRREL